MQKMSLKQLHDINDWADRQIEAKDLELEILKQNLFSQQRAMLNDKSKRKGAICSRRAGKTYTVGADLLGGIYDRTPGDCAYIGLTRGHAKKLMFNHVQKLQKKYNYKLTPNRAELTWTCDKTGNTLYITGANNEEDTEKLRGLSLKKIVLDEAASFKHHINYLIDEVLEPTTIDTNGEITMIGTPSANPLDENIFFRVTSGIETGWSIHKWTILDNVYIPHARQWLEDYRIRKGWDDKHPAYLREWCGLWTTDKSSLVYKYDEAKQDYDKLPEGFKWTHVLGVDLGFDDAFAIVVLAFSYELPNHVFVVDEFKKEGLIPERMAHQIMLMKEAYRPVAIVADTGGLGKAIVEEFKYRYRLNVEKADKAGKLAFIEIVNGDLYSGIIKIKSQSELAQEMKTHQWDPESQKQKEDDRTENHLVDALLYCFKKVKHYLATPRIDEPPAGSNKALDKEAERMLKLELERIKKRIEEEENDL